MEQYLKVTTSSDDDVFIVPPWAQSQKKEKTLHRALLHSIFPLCLKENALPPENGGTGAYHLITWTSLHIAYDQTFTQWWMKPPLIILFSLNKSSSWIYLWTTIVSMSSDFTPLGPKSVCRDTKRRGKDNRRFYVHCTTRQLCVDGSP